MTKLVTEQMRETWKPVLEAEDRDVRALTRSDIYTRMFENQAEWCKNNAGQLNQVNEAAAPGNATAGVATWAPVLIKMVKRMAPNLVSMDFMGTQPLSTPDGLIFAMRARYDSQTGDEAFYNTIKTGHSGNGQVDEGDPSGLPKGTIDATSGSEVPLKDPMFGSGMTTAEAETLGAAGGKAWAKMALTIEKNSVSAKSRGLFADYSHELRQDLMAVHGEDADALLSDMLITEILAEMNREFVLTINKSAKMGGLGCAKQGVFDLSADTDGRWFLERLKALIFQVELESNAVATDTRRGKANRILCSPNVASALAMAGMLDFTPALAQNASLTVDATGQTFAGVLSTGHKVYIDPYAKIEYITVVYKGESELDAGWFFAPYTPLEMYRSAGEDSMQPRMAFKTRYAVCASPFYSKTAAGADVAGKGLGQSENGYGRKMAVTKLF